MTPTTMQVTMARTCLASLRIPNLYGTARYLSTASILTSAQYGYYYGKYDGWSKTEFEKVPITGG